MRGKRWTAAALCLLLLLFQLSMPPSRAAGTSPFFVAAGDSILPLSDQTMPFWANGYLYIDSAIFTDTGRTSLRVTRSLNGETQLVLYDGSQSLWFELGADHGYGLDGSTYSPGCLERNGRIFVPAAVVARFFGLLYSVTDVQLQVNGQRVSGYMVWLRRPGFVMADREFFAAATYAIASRYEDYLRTRQDQEESQEPPEQTQPEIEGRSVYLCLRADGRTGSLLDTLDRYQAQAAFFCTPAFLEEQGDLLRRMTATGQSIGILADAGDPERTVAEQLEAGGAALERATCGRTRLALVENGGEEDRETAREMGFRCLAADLDRSGYELYTANNASTLLRRISARRDNVSVWLSDRASAAGLAAFLSAAGDMEGRCLAWTETS